MTVNGSRGDIQWSNCTATFHIMTIATVPCDMSVMNDIMNMCEHDEHKHDLTLLKLTYASFDISLSKLDVSRFHLNLRVLVSVNIY